MIVSNKRFLIISVLALVIILSFIKPFYIALKNVHKDVLTDSSFFYKVFKDSVRLYSDPDMQGLPLGLKRKSDYYYNYYLQNGITAHILTLNDVPDIKMKDVCFERNLNFSPISYVGFETFFPNMAGWPIINMKLKFPLPTLITVNFSQYSNIEVINRTANYIAYYGKFYAFSLSNELDNPLIWFDLKKCSESLVVFYTYENKFYIIILNSYKKLEKSSLDLLDLKN